MPWSVPGPGAPTRCAPGGAVGPQERAAVGGMAPAGPGTPWWRWGPPHSFQTSSSWMLSAMAFAGACSEGHSLHRGKGWLCHAWQSYGRRRQPCRRCTPRCWDSCVGTSRVPSRISSPVLPTCIFRAREAPTTRSVRGSGQTSSPSPVRPVFLSLWERLRLSGDLEELQLRQGRWPRSTSSSRSCHAVRQVPASGVAEAPEPWVERGHLPCCCRS